MLIDVVAWPSDSRGTEAYAAAADGMVIEPPPNPRTNKATPSRPYDVLASANTNGNVPISDNAAPPPETARAPNRSLKRPMMGSPQKIPSPSGNSINPVPLGEASRTFRNQSGKSNWPPKLIALDRNCVAAAARKTSALNNLKSINAVTGWRSARQVKPASSSTLASRLSTAVALPCAHDTSPCSNSARPGEIITNPMRSKRRALVISSRGSANQAKQMARMPTGTLTKKIHRQPRRPRITPPRLGPN